MHSLSCAIKRHAPDCRQTSTYYSNKNRTILQRLAESVNFSAVSSDDIKDLMADNIDDLFKSANEFDDFLNNYIDFTVKM